MDDTRTGLQLAGRDAQAVGAMERVRGAMRTASHHRRWTKILLRAALAIGAFLAPGIARAQAGVTYFCPSGYTLTQIQGLQLCLSADGNTTIKPVINRAEKPFVSDAVQYVSQKNGNDANDGLSAGSAKLTPQAAINALPACSTSKHCGTVWIAPSATAYTGPTAFYSGVYLRNTGSSAPQVIWSKFNAAAFNSFSAPPGNANSVTFSYSTSLAISDVSQIGIIGIDMDFGGAGNLTLSGVSWSTFEMGVTGAALTAPALIWNSDAGNSLNSTGNYADWIVTEGGNEGIKFGNGGGGSQGVTENSFGQIYILADAQPSGTFTAIDLAGQCDSNTFDQIHFWFSTAVTMAQGIVYNSSSTTADKDADGTIIHFYDETGAGYTGNSITVNPSTGNSVTTGVLLGSTKISYTSWSGNSALYWNRLGDAFPSSASEILNVPTLSIDNGQTGFPSIYFRKNNIVKWQFFPDGSDNLFLADGSANRFGFIPGTTGKFIVIGTGGLQLDSSGGGSVTHQAPNTASTITVTDPVATTLSPVAASCTMTTTTCTITVPSGVSFCTATEQGGVLAGGCAISGTTLTVTAASSNTNTWAVLYW